MNNWNDWDEEDDFFVQEVNINRVDENDPDAAIFAGELDLVDFPEVRVFSEPLPSPGYDIDLFVNADEAEDFICTFCSDIVKDPRTHNKGEPGSQCKLIACYECIKYYVDKCNYEEKAPYCPRKCSNDQDVQVLYLDGLYFNVTFIPDELFAKLRCLKMVCQFGCLINYSDYEDHVLTCQGLQFCSICDVEIGPNHSCTEEFRKLKEEAKRASELLQQNNVVIQDQQSEINRLQAQVTALQSRRNDEPGSSNVPGLSNHINVQNSYRGIPRITVRFEGRDYPITGLTLDNTTEELRMRLRRQLGVEVGPILFINHTPLRENVPLRRHQLGHRPVTLTALRPNQTIAVGQSLLLNIRGPGPIH